MKGKMILGLAVAILGLVLAAMPAQAVTFGVDDLIGAVDSDNSGIGTETTLLQGFCSCTATLIENIDTFSVLVDDAGHFYLDVAPNEPGYFVLKFGTGNTGNDMFFFQNINELTKLVWDPNELIDEGLPENHILSLSHYAITGGTTTNPEPASLILLGAGLAGIGIWRRKLA